MKYRLVWHPYLFSLFPVLFLYAQNAHHMMISEITKPVILVLGVTVLIVVLLNLIFRNIPKTSIIVSLFILSFFSWRAFLDLTDYLNSNNFFGIQSLWHWILFCLFGALILSVFIIIILTKSSLIKVTSLANFISLVLVIIQVGTGGWVIIKRPALEKSNEISLSSQRKDIKTPNIYYIITDAYAGNDVLKDIYNFDNSDFLSQLKDMGFYVADSSCSNYCQTLLSLASSLNFNQVDQLGRFSRYEDDRAGLIDLFQNNRLIKILKQYDYKIVNFQSGYNMTKLELTDYLFEAEYNLSEFNSTLISYTPLPVLSSMISGDSLSLSRTGYMYKQARERILYTLDKLPHLSGVEEPYFVLAHIICPHPPFLWDDKGNDWNPDRIFDFSDGTHYMHKGGTYDEYMTGYKNQISFFTPLFLKTVKGILAANPDNPPVIIIQADHGPGSCLDWRKVNNTDLRERFSILNAYYLPGVDTSGFYPSISPINTFRMVLNEYFETDYPMLPDKSFYSLWARPFEFTDVTDRIDSMIKSGTYLRLSPEKMSKPYGLRR